MSSMHKKLDAERLIALANDQAEHPGVGKPAEPGAGFALVSLETLERWRQQANDIAAWSVKADRVASACRLKQEIRDAMDASQERVRVHGGPLTYSSTQATSCACCGEHKHTPLRIDAMGGYVCLVCIDKKLGSLLGGFGYPQAGKAARKTPGMAVQALAAEIVDALLADEKDGVFDLMAGKFGPKFSALVRRWAELEFLDASQPERQPLAGDDNDGGVVESDLIGGEG